MGLQRPSAGRSKEQGGESSARPLHRSAAAERGQLVLVSSLVRVHNELVTRRVRLNLPYPPIYNTDPRCPACRPLAGNRQTSELFRGGRAARAHDHWRPSQPTTPRARRTVVLRVNLVTRSRHGGRRHEDTERAQARMRQRGRSIGRPTRQGLAATTTLADELAKMRPRGTGTAQ